MSEAELTIRQRVTHVRTPVQSLWFGFAEGFGKTLGIALAVALVIVVLSWAGVLEDNEPEVSTDAAPAALEGGDA